MLVGYSNQPLELTEERVDSVVLESLARVRFESRRLPGKRVGDVVLSAGLLLFLVPLALVTIVAIKWETRGPVVYRQARLGLRGRPFTLFKFRSMRIDSHELLERILLSDDERRLEYHTYHKLTDDPRVTTVGKFLRRSSLDEIPQLVNVLIGDMSIVGPRPYLPTELGKMGEHAREILSVRPGLTGLWQTSGRNRLPFAERVRLDVEYVKTASWWRDAGFLVSTLPAIIKGEGAL